MEVACASRVTLKMNAPQMRRSQSSVAAPARMPAAKMNMSVRVASQKQAVRGVAISAKQGKTVATGRTTRLAIDASKNTIIAGAPASGKGTQCEGIVEKYGLTHISTGDMLRAAVKAGTEAGKAAKGFMDAGALVPDEVIIAMVKDRLNEDDCKKNGWLLDGFPRTGAQADALEEIGVKPDKVILLNVPDDVLVERVVGRRSDPETGKIYHLTFFPPPAEIVDRLVHRSDDTEEACRSRLKMYYNNLEAIKNAYADKIVALDGNQDKKIVGDLIAKALE